MSNPFWVHLLNCPPTPSHGLQHDFAGAEQYYREVLNEYAASPRAHFGLGRSLQLQAEEADQEDRLDRAIVEFQKVLEEYDTPDELFRWVGVVVDHLFGFREAAENLVECARFRGNLHKVMTVQRELMDRFPADLDVQNDFGVTFLMMGRADDARSVFTTVLEADPQNVVAQAYYGYLLKVYDRDLEKGVHFMRKGLANREQPIMDAK